MIQQESTATETRVGGPAPAFVSMPEPGLSPAVSNGPTAAALLAAGIGAAAMGLVSALSHYGAFPAPVLWAPIGGLSGKVAIALLIWLAVWGGLNFRWKAQPPELSKIVISTLILTVLGLLGTFLPFML